MAAAPAALTKARGAAGCDRTAKERHRFLAPEAHGLA